MNKKQITDLTIAIFLVITGSLLLVFPLINFMNVKTIFCGVLIIYAVLNCIKYILTRKSKDFEGLLTFLASFITLVVALKIDITLKPWNLAVSLFIWVILMSLIKLKKSDYYNDRKNKMWIIKMVSLGLFILTGILSTINLYYTVDIQILVLGFFFLINGILDLLEPLCSYIQTEKK